MIIVFSAAVVVIKPVCQSIRPSVVYCIFKIDRRLYADEKPNTYSLWLVTVASILGAERVTELTEERRG